MATEVVTQHSKSNLLMLYAVQGEAGGTTHISTSFLKELSSKVDTVVGVNSGLSLTSLERQRYNHDLDKQAEDIVSLYKEAIPEDKRDQSITIVGHSMGGTTGPLVARRLLEEGFNVDQLVLIAPPIADRTDKDMLKSFIALGNKEHIEPDIAILYPSPQDIASFADRLTELSRKPYLSLEEREERAAYELAVLRQAEPDRLTLLSMKEDERDEVRDIDERLNYLVNDEIGQNAEQIDLLQKQRRRIILRALKRNIPGKIGGKPTQKLPNMLKVVGHGFSSLGEMKGSISDLAHEDRGTVASIESLIEYRNTHRDEHPLTITLVAGSTDPIPGDYQIGEVNNIHVAPHTTVTEIGMTNFDHFSLASDPVRVAHVVDRIMDQRAA